MTKKKNKASSSASNAQTARPAQPSWRKPPARSRRQIHNQKANSRRLSAQVTPPAAVRPAARPSARTGVRLHDGEMAVPRDWRALLRTILRQGLALVLLAAVIYGLVEFFQLPALAVTSSAAQIGGAHRLAPRAIYDASGVEGRNIFLVRQAEIEANLREMPGIASADVHLRLPNQILIDVQELRPLVAWQAGEETVWLAADGGVVPQAGAVPPLTLVDTTNTALAGSDAWRHKVLAHLAELQAGHPGLTTFGYGDPQGLYYQSAEGWEVWLGDTGPMTHKVTVSAKASAQLAQSGAETRVIDLRFSDERGLWW